MQRIIVVTGGAGFVGSHLCEALAKDSGNTVISIDNYFTGSESNHVAGVKYIRGHTKDIETLLHSSEKPELLFHLGEYSRTEQSLAEPAVTFNLNTVGTFAVLEYCRKNTVRLIYSGSSTKFADQGDGRDQSPYAFTKAVNTELVQNYGRWYGISYAITYFYNVYGPREIADGPYATVIARFISQWKAGKPLTVTSPGTQERIFTHVDDIIAGLLLVGEKGEGDEYGLGADDAYSILAIAQMFTVPIEMTPERAGNRMGATLNAERSHALGWKATKRVEDYIRVATSAK